MSDSEAMPEPGPLTEVQTSKSSWSENGLVIALVVLFAGALGSLFWAQSDLRVKVEDENAKLSKRIDDLISEKRLSEQRLKSWGEQYFSLMCGDLLGGKYSSSELSCTMADGRAVKFRQLDFEDP